MPGTRRQCKVTYDGSFNPAYTVVHPGDILRSFTVHVTTTDSPWDLLSVDNLSADLRLEEVDHKMLTRGQTATDFLGGGGSVSVPGQLDFDDPRRVRFSFSTGRDALFFREGSRGRWLAFAVYVEDGQGRTLGNVRLPPFNVVEW